MTKITSLTALTTAATTDNLVIVDNSGTPTTKKITWANLVKSLATPTKGNILVGDGSTFGALTVGTNNYVLTADSAQTYGVKWAASAGGMNEATEASSTPVSDDTESTGGANYLYLGNLITLPTTEKHYKITAVEWKNGTVVNGNVIGGVLGLDAQPPTLANITVFAKTASTAQTGTSAVQKVSVESSLVLAGGSSICGFLLTNSASGRFRYLSVSSQNNTKVMSSFAISWNDTTAWSANTPRMYLKIYYKGYT